MEAQGHLLATAPMPGRLHDVNDSLHFRHQVEDWIEAAIRRSQRRSAGDLVGGLSGGILGGDVAPVPKP